MPKNHLANETSLYLKQHANNPVDWYPWCEEALKLAKETNKPILLSIGYSACHWCHVMSHESFDDKETAKLMNNLFVNIKVDREERPDLDLIYQTSLQILMQKPGGWPLTLFLTPDNHIPFFGGTYFPKHTNFGIMSFKEVLKKVSDYYQDHQQEIHDLAKNIQLALNLLSEPKSDKKIHLNDKPLHATRIHLNSEYDPIHGGFGSAPKFPLSHQLLYLLHYWHDHQKDDEALSIVNHSLKKIALSGLYDHVGSGFYRYSVDEEWIIPHFEKMLYDNAQLLSLYSTAFNVTQTPLFKERANSIAEWIIQKMQSPEGGYYSTINADSEKEEGKFYVWDKKDIRRLLNEDEFSFIEKYFSLDHPANFETHWHLFATKTLDEIASELNILTTEANTLYHDSIQKLFKAREKRIHPNQDQKIIVGWNALTIKAMLIAGIYLNKPEFIESAECALLFIMKNMWQDHRLFASFSDSKSKQMAYLDDYVYLLDALLEYLQVKWSDHHFQFTIELTKSLCRNFLDDSQGGFYFTAHDNEPLIQRPKPIIDNATPAGNGIAIYVLQRLGYLLGNQQYLNIAEQTLQMVWASIEKYPTASISVMFGLSEYLTPPVIIILRGVTNDFPEWQNAFYKKYHPHHLCFAIPNHAEDLPDALDKPSPESGVAAYLCQGYQCFKTLYTLEEFKEYLEKK